MENLFLCFDNLGTPQGKEKCESFLIFSGASNKSKVGLIAGLIAGLIVALLLVGLLFLLCKRRYKGYKGEVFEDVPGNC